MLLKGTKEKVDMENKNSKKTLIIILLVIAATLIISGIIDEYRTMKIIKTVDSLTISNHLIVTTEDGDIKEFTDKNLEIIKKNFMSLMIFDNKKKHIKKYKDEKLFSLTFFTEENYKIESEIWLLSKKIIEDVNVSIENLFDDPDTPLIMIIEGHYCKVNSQILDNIEHIEGGIQITFNHVDGSDVVDQRDDERIYNILKENKIIKDF